MELKNGVLGLLEQSNGISVQDEWLDACMQWILEEEGPSLSVHRLYQLVYEQWLHADLRDVATLPCLPALTHDSGHISGRFIVQMSSVVDVGSAAYGQLQKVKGQSTDNIEESEKKNFDPKPTRLLLLTLADSATEIQAMEYMSVPQLTVDMIPGTKLVLQGEIPYRLGMLLLSADNIHILGGGVEQLATENNPLRTLSRILNLEDPGLEPTDSAQNQEPVVTDSLPQASAAASLRDTNQTDAEVAHTFQVAGICNEAPAQAHEEGFLNEQDYEEGLDDLNDFDDFGMDDELMHAEMNEGDGLVDEPGHDQWPDEFDDDLFDSNINYDASHSANVRSESFCSAKAEGQHPMDTVPGAVSKQLCSSKSKLRLKQPKSKTRVIEAAPSARRPPLVASVRPVQSGETGSRPPSPDSSDVLSEEPLLLESLSQVSTLSWLSHPLVKVHAHFIKVCEKIGHNDGGWVATVVIADSSGARLTVNLSNEILEEMIGFTAVEFRNHINPNRNDPILKSKAGKGFARCQSAIFQLNCFMVITKTNPSKHPCVIQLLDS